MSDMIKFSFESIINANFNLLDNNFQFIVKDKAFETNKFIASILSPAVSNLLLSDQTICSFEINTKSDGNFSKFLNLFKTPEQIISNEDKDKEFISELLEILQNPYIRIELNSKESEITYKNVFQTLNNHVKCPLYYRDFISKDIEILSSNMYRILCKEEEKKCLFELKAEFLEQILNNEHLLIKSEDQLLEFINELYKKDHSYSILYKYVDYLYCSSNSMHTFLNLFPIEEFDQEVWSQLKERLEKSFDFTTITRQRKHRNVFSKGYKDFDGIIKHFQQLSNNHITNEIEITASSIYNDDDNLYGKYKSVQYDNIRPFITKNDPIPWICFEFKNYQIIPTHYTIRIRRDDYGSHILRSWKIEVKSTDESDWDVIDKRENCQLLTSQSPIQTFSIDESKQKEAKFIRLTLTGPNSDNYKVIAFDSIEFYGCII